MFRSYYIPANISFEHKQKNFSHIFVQVLFLTTLVGAEKCKKKKKRERKKKTKPDLLHSVMCHSETAQDKNNIKLSWRNTLDSLAYLLHMTLRYQQLEKVLEIRTGKLTGEQATFILARLKFRSCSRVGERDASRGSPAR